MANSARLNDSAQKCRPLRNPTVSFLRIRSFAYILSPKRVFTSGSAEKGMRREDPRPFFSPPRYVKFAIGNYPRPEFPGIKDVSRSR